MGPIEDEVAILVREDYYRVSLLAFRFHASPQSGQAIFIVGLMQDQTAQVHEEEVFEGGDHVAGALRERSPALDVSPAAAPEEVEQDEPAEEEQRDDQEESYDAQKQVDCVQSSPFNGCGLDLPPQTVGTAGFEPATTRPPAECATRLRHVPTRL